MSHPSRPEDNAETAEHLRFMRQALRLAALGEGRASPNPMVGALVVRQGIIVGRGYHVYERRLHAEVVALEQAGPMAAGADLYVTLEPCCHHGRTPPCTEAILRSGVRRVFAAVSDPNPLVAGQGFQELRDAGIEVCEGLLEDTARRMNAGFFHSVRHRRPWVTLKLGMSLDGRIAAPDGSSKWITGEASRRDVQRLRYASDAVLVGIGTVLKDNPSLDVRWRRKKSILKVILDAGLRCPLDARLFESGDPVLVFSAASGKLGSAARSIPGATIVEVDEKGGELDWLSVLQELGRRQVRNLLVEGGSAVAGSLLRSGLANRVRFYIAPMILGGDAVAGLGALGLPDLGHAIRLEQFTLRRLGRDFVVEADVATWHGRPRP